MHSCLYEGRVRHRRFSPRPHRFSYSLLMTYLDLDETAEVFDGRLLWSTGDRWAPAWFRRQDHVGDPREPLKTAISRLIRERTGKTAQGPIRLLTQMRCFGYYFSPVNFYFCFDSQDRAVETIVAEVSNTPWRERYCYVLSRDLNQGSSQKRRYALQKEFHVSPFMPMDLDYVWRFAGPGRRLVVHMENFRDGDRIFDSTLTLSRKEITTASLARAVAGHPFETIRVMSAIYLQALRLWMKKTPFHSHPDPRKRKFERSAP